VLPDPDPSLGIEAVRQVYASSYPEIITAAVSGPDVVDGKEVFTFKTAVGTQKPDKPHHSWCDGLDFTQRTLRRGRLGGQAAGFRVGAPLTIWGLPSPPIGHHTSN
jgi:PRTRC genetic system protein C